MNGPEILDKLQCLDLDGIVSQHKSFVMYDKSL